MMQPTVEQILDTFFGHSSIGKHPTTVARYRRVEGHLHRYLDAEGAETLCIESQILLTAEQEFNPNGAFARVLQAEDLLYTLPGFLAPQWMLPASQDQKTQAGLTSRLTQWLCTKQLIDKRWHSCAILETQHAADQARRQTALRPALPPAGPPAPEQP